MTTTIKLASIVKNQVRMKRMISPINTIPLISRSFYSSLANTTISIAKDKNNLVDIQPILSSPCLVLPMQEAINERIQARTFLGRCLYDIGRKSFVPAGVKSKMQQEKETSLASEDSLCIGSSHGWLAFFSLSSFSLFLMNPFTLQTIPLPSLETLTQPCFDEDLFPAGKKRCPTTDVAKALKFLNGENKKYIEKNIFDKIVLSSPPDFDSANCKVMIAYRGSKSCLAFCGIGDSSWINLDAKRNMSFRYGYEDVAYSNKKRKFYGIVYSDECEVRNAVERIDEWDLLDASLPEKRVLKPLSINHPKLDDLGDDQSRYACVSWKYLVESLGEILLVKRYSAEHVADVDDVALSCKEDPCCEFPRKTVRFDVLKLDTVKEKLKVVKNLGDQALFLGINHSFSLPASEFPGIKANSIYFTDHYSELRWAVDVFHGRMVQNCGFDGHDFGIFNLEDNSISPCYESETKNFSPRPIWFEPPQFVRD